MLNAPPAQGQRRANFDPLRDELARRRARRYRRRWLARWRRRRLLLRLVAVEFELADPRDETLRELHQREARRLEARLSRNARRLFR